MSFQQPYPMRDVISRYPTLASSLRNLSKEYEITTFEGKCNLPPTSKEIKDYINDKPDTSIIFLGRYSDSDLKLNYKEKHENMLDTITIIPIPYIHSIKDNRYLVVQNNALINFKQYEPDIGILTDSRIADHKEYSNYKRIDELIMLKKSNGYDTFVDIITTYNIFNKRLNCIQVSNNYAKEETIKYFKDIVASMNNYTCILLLNLYLILNAELLKLDSIILTNVDDYDHYDQYISDTEHIRDDLYNKILDAINNF